MKIQNETPGASDGFFFELVPDRVLQAVEATGLFCTGRCFTLNSFENRVYDVELEALEGSPVPHPSANHRIVKFYRPHRWSLHQIREEHEFLSDLNESEIPAIAPLKFPSGNTVESVAHIYYSLFPKVGGRAPDELNFEQLIRIGRLLGRIHNVGAQKKAPSRLRLDPHQYGLSNLEFLIQNRWIPAEFESRYQAAVEKICHAIEPWFKDCDYQRIHGDCHLGNLVWNAQGPFFLDFDDMVSGPCVQDIWMLVPGRDEQARQQREILLEGYTEFRKFDRLSLRLIEPLRALRFIHYTAWIARRWQDPAFPQAFPNFGTHAYWSSELKDLEEQLALITQKQTKYI